MTLPAAPAGLRCHYCGAPAEVWDHVVPQSLGGPDTQDNLVPACHACNSAKSALPADVFQLSKRERSAWLKGNGWTRLGANSWMSPDESDRAFYSMVRALQHEGFERTGLTASRSLAPAPRAKRPTPVLPNTWTFYGKRRDFKRSGVSLSLVYEIEGSAMSDDYDPTEINAWDLLIQWWRTSGNTNPLYELPPNHVPIYWYVQYEGGFEGAPFCEMAERLYQHHNSTPCNFLEYFTWPENDEGELLNWLTLPVTDKRWHDQRADKGGFIQEALGWKPSAMQPSVDMVRLAAAAGWRLSARNVEDKNQAEEWHESETNLDESW